MTPLADLVAQGTAHAWVFIPSAILLGALHGLEPGHSKTMMAAFIVAVRGTIGQAVLLALAATVSHTAIVWILAGLALTFGNQWNAAATEPYFQLASGMLVIGIAVWMLLRTRRSHGSAAPELHGHDHAHGTRYEHAVTGMAAGLLPRAGGRTVAFAGAQAAAYGGDGSDHVHEPSHDLDFGGLEDEAAMDAHARAHADEIRAKFAGRPVTTAQIVLFGLTGGLLPCSAAITVLILCLQLRQVWLGLMLVLFFSIGLALTLLASGVVAAWGVRHVGNLLGDRFSRFARAAPYLSGGLIILVGIYIGLSGLMQIV